MDKAYNPQKVEQKWYKFWIERGLHKAKIPSCFSKEKTFSMVIPPPNVTGSLHIGHALNCTLQDILVRYKKMKGFNTLWVPGTDHAGIATQLMVERELEKEGLSRYQLGRERFLERVWEWKEKSGGRIVQQLKRLGVIPDWTRERFTLDEGLSRAVIKVFVDLYREGLIYKDKRLVNWDPKLQTAISDLEVEQREVSGNYWYIKYPIENSDRFITVATTRPETLLGDTAIAVHPDDERYKDLIGKYAIVPLCNRRIPIIADEYSDPEKGTGAVKITPAHDFNDFEVGKRHNLEIINIFDTEARLNDNVPKRFRGLDRFEARKKIVEELEKLGLIEKVEKVTHTVPYGDRSGVIIEPFLTDQWYVNAAKLAMRAIEVVENEEIKFFPDFWRSTYLEWMRKIEPWCISRQLWWGHRIPAWYGPDGKVFVDYDETLARKQARCYYEKDVELVRDPDVLDTWFSSALWPFSTLGWPEDTEEMRYFFPTNTLVTAFDIIFFWVARMIMMSLKFTGKVPFKHVYIHGLIRDDRGEKMSKTRGNVIDPLDVIEKYGADSLRFTLTALATQGRDIKLSYSVIEGYRNFINKIWNASRFIILNLNKNDAYSTEIESESLFAVDKWILTKLNEVLRSIETDFDNYEFDKVANKVYQFVWHEFCDWYIEFVKPDLYGSDLERKKIVQNILIHVLVNSLKVLHPIIPHVTEEIYHLLIEYSIDFGQKEVGLSILETDFPVCDDSLLFEQEHNQIEFIKEVVSAIRNLRATLRIHPSKDVSVIIRVSDETMKSHIENSIGYIVNLASASSIKVTLEEAPQRSVSQVIAGAEIFIPVEGVVDVDKEAERISKDLEKVAKEMDRSANKLNNPKFMNKAPKEIIEKEKNKFEELKYQKEKLENVLSMLRKAFN